MLTAALLGPASAGATTFCVSDTACEAAGGTASANLGAALASATTNPGHDRVEVGVGSFDEATGPPSGFTYLGTDPLELVGEGVGQTVLRDSAAVVNGFEPVLVLTGPNTTVSGFTFEMGINTERGLSFAQGAAASNVEARFAMGVTPSSTIAFVLTGTGGESLSNASADLSASSSSQAVNVIGDPGATIQDVEFSAFSGIVIAVTSTSAENAIRRARLTVTTGDGVSVSGGSTTVESSLVKVTGSGRGLSMLNTNMLTGAFGLEARHVTLIGPGSGGTGASVFAADTAGAQLPSLALHDSIVFGFGGPLSCADASTTPPGDDDFPTLTTDYSNYPSTGVSISPGCTATFTEANHLNLDPVFVNPASDFRLQMGSPLVDAGTPGPLGGGESITDLDGNPRLTDGDTDGTARRDLGAYELQPLTPPPPGGGGGGPASAPKSFFGDLVLRALKKRGRLAGVLTSDSAACVLGRLIEIFRVRKGPDPRIRTAVAGSDGRFKLARRVGPGRYYGEADALSLPAGDFCAADRSAKATLKRR